MRPTEDQIRARWRLDKLPVKATRENIALAIRRTGNPYGITCHGLPYVEPCVGMKVVTTSGKKGKIVEVRKPMLPGGDPEVRIRTRAGDHFLFQTAINGYSPAKP